jgi:hypothetical protein
LHRCLQLLVLPLGSVGFSGQTQASLAQLLALCRVLLR